MLTRFNVLTAAVLSGVTASFSFAMPGSAAQDKPVVVYAEPQENIRTERVSYADLNLAQSREERRLSLRVASAVRRVCLYEDKPGLQHGVYYDCAAGAWDHARPQMAQAIARAKEIAMTGQSSIAATAITVRVAS
jgi:UrcA family protein